MSDDVVTQTVEIAPPRVTPFAPLRHRDFRLLWSGLVISNAGSWMQFTALGYLMDQLTLSPLFLGILGLVQAVPRLLFAFLGGVLADRANRRLVLLWTNLVAMGSATLLAVLTYLHLIQVWQLLLIAGFNSFIQSFDMPARQSMTPSLVEDHELLQAVSLNSLAFNGSSIFGPALAGVVISLSGVHGAFLLNAVSYVAVVWALITLRVPGPDAETRLGLAQDIREGLGLLVRYRIVLVLLMTVGVLSFFGRPYIRLMPSMAREVLHVGPRGLGALQAAPGLGTLFAVFFTGWSVGRIRRGRLLIGSALAMGVLVALFGLSTSFPLSLALLVGVGAGQSVALATGNTLMQTTVPPGARGRAMGLFGTVAFGMMALGTLPVGAAAEVLGLSRALSLGGVIVVGALLILALFTPRLRSL